MVLGLGFRVLGFRVYGWGQRLPSKAESVIKSQPISISISIPKLFFSVASWCLFCFTRLHTPYCKPLDIMVCNDTGVLVYCNDTKFIVCNENRNQKSLKNQNRVNGVVVIVACKSCAGCSSIGISF